MTEILNMDWEQANQRYLMTAIGQVRSMLERPSVVKENDTQTEDHTTDHNDLLGQISQSMPAPPALEILSKVFHLSNFERNIILLCAGIEMDSSFSRSCALAQGDSHRNYPTFGLALAVFPEPHWSALAPGGPLRFWRLVELNNAEGLVSATLHIDERILHFLAGINEIDARLRDMTKPATVSNELVSSHRELVHRIVKIWSTAKGTRSFPVIQLSGSDRNIQQSISVEASREIGLHVRTIRPADIPAAIGERESLTRLWEREAMLSNSSLFIDADEMDQTEYARTLIPFIENTRGVLIVNGRESLRTHDRNIVRFEVPKPSSADQKGLWQKIFGETFNHINGQMDPIVTQFSLDSNGIQAVHAKMQGTGCDEKDFGRELWEACRVQSRLRLDNLAQHIETVATWKDLILPEAQHMILREIVDHVAQRAKVYERWGFAGKGARNLGISALFAGSSGTGKTMAAEVLANELRLDLYRIDLSQMVSKYIGETEKNLRRVFDAADDGGAILLFDEADALFGKRSEVKDSHDRYANIEVSYLLQRMETYRGLAILTTNMKSALDPAFLRRIRFVVQFPFPDANDRARIWQGIFPSDAPAENLDVQKLSKLNVAGGNIRNIAMNAAFLAAGADEPIRMNHLLRAAQTEYAKLEKQLTETEVGNWV